MENLKCELAFLRDAFAHGAIDLACFLRNVERVEFEIAYIGGAA